MRPTAAQWYCLAAGSLLLIRGATVLIADPDFATPGEGWHAAFHLASGIPLLVAFFIPGIARAAVAVFAGVYGALTVVGLAAMGDVAGAIPIDARDSLVHGVYVAAALVVLVVPGRRVPAPSR